MAPLDHPSLRFSMSTRRALSAAGLTTLDDVLAVQAATPSVLADIAGLGWEGLVEIDEVAARTGQRPVVVLSDVTDFAIASESDRSTSAA